MKTPSIVPILICGVLYLASSATAAEFNFPISKGQDEKLYNMYYLESQDEREAALQKQEENHMETTEDPDAPNGKRVRVQMFNRGFEDPTYDQAVAAAEKRLRLQAMGKRIRLQSMSKRAGDMSMPKMYLVEPQKRYRLQSLKREVLYPDVQLQPFEKRMRLQSLNKRMRLQSI